MRSIVTFLTVALLAASIVAPAVAATTSSVHQIGAIHMNKHKEKCPRCQKN